MADYAILGPDPRWRRFEKLVARMICTLSPDGTEVVYDDSIRGHLSQADRQIDVSIRSKSGGRTELVIVQCRDHKSRLDVNAVGEFAAVIGDVEASRGVMISVHGWTDTAKTYARALNIELLRLVDAEQKIWAEYFGSEPPTFRQVLKLPTLVTYRHLELSFEFHSSRVLSGFRMPFETHLGELVYADGAAAGSPADIIGRLWTEEVIPHQPGAGLLVIELSEPVFFEIDPSRTPICRFLWAASVVETHRFGWWQITKMEGLANDLDGTILSRGFTLAPLNPEDVENNWQRVASPDSAPARPIIRLHMTSGWELNEKVNPPRIADIRSVSDQEFVATDCVCEASAPDLPQERT
jgi:hypothetical protein